MADFPQILINQLPILEGTLHTQVEIDGSLYVQQELTGELHLPLAFVQSNLVDDQGYYIITSDSYRILMPEIII